MLSTEGRHPSVHSFRHHFDSTTLVDFLQPVSRPFHELAQHLVGQVVDDPELTEALRKLWEAKNSAVLLAAVQPKRAAES